MKRFVFPAIAVMFFFIDSEAQLNRYVVLLKNKGATPYTLVNPSPYLSQRAIDRRTHYSIAIDSTDLPVPASYVAQIAAIPNVTILNVSRWLNGVSIRTTDANAITAINALPFVQSTKGVAAKTSHRTSDDLEVVITRRARKQSNQQRLETNHFDYGTSGSFDEIHLHNGEFLHNIGLLGQGMQIAMLDGGFFHYTSMHALDSANLNNQFLSTWDFVNREASVVEDDSHGMSCLSTIAANIPGLFIGKAPKASFHLFKTEDIASEYPIEEFNWACGAERADSVGADILSSSLGYGNDFDPPVPDYPYSDFNGNVTMSARAADFAAKKGILVFIAAGNDGNNPWHMINTPADADSIISVGAVNTAGVVAGFSGYGPSADGQVKPEVASIGLSAMIQTSGNAVALSNGTSFACPNMAGLGTCLWQGFPEFNNMRIVRALKEAGSIFTTPDNRIGYGIPDMKKAFADLLKDFVTASVTQNNCSATLSWTSKDVSAMKYEIERRAPGEPGFTKAGEVNPQAGNTLATHTYQFTNSLENVDQGDVSYRIKQIIDTAAASFRQVYIAAQSITLSSSCIISEDKVVIAPNPPNSGDAILLVQTGYAITTLQIVIYDMNGHLLTQLVRSKSSGKSLFTLPTNRLAKGKYVIKVYNDNKVVGTTNLLKL